MVRPDMSKWEQTVADLRRLSVEAVHPRTRERFLALYMIASKQKNATEWAVEIGRQDETVLNWVHKYNAAGPEALVYRRSGGRPPPFSPEQVAEIIETVKETEPVDHNLPGHNWTLKKVKRWLKQKFQRTASNTTLRQLLKAHRLSWKKCQKVLRKANPEQRAAFIERFAAMYERVCREEILLLYLDEAHIHRDMDLGYTWAPVGQPAWRTSSCPPLADRINWYGGYDFSHGRCFIWNEGACNQDNTVRFLRHLADWLGDVTSPVVIIWDGAPWHRAGRVQEAAAEFGFLLLPLPAYSPDLNPIEGLWKWMREEVTRNHCHPTMRALFDACKAFIERINLDPQALISRLWPKFELDPAYEELLVSS